MLSDFLGSDRAARVPCAEHVRAGLFYACEYVRQARECVTGCKTERGGCYGSSNWPSFDEKRERERREEGILEEKCREGLWDFFEGC